MAKRKKSPDSTETFEESLSRLQEIVRQIESGKLTLDESLARYEEGINHLRSCFSMLDRVEQKIRLLIDVDEDGTAVTRKFDHRATPTTSAKKTIRDDEDEGVDPAEEDEFDDEEPNGLF